MEVSLRSFRVFGRFFRKSAPFTSCRHVTATAVKEELNTELLNSYNNDIKAGGVVPVFRRALLFPVRVALQDDVGIYTYAGLHRAASLLSKEISDQLHGASEKTIAYMCNNDASHVIVQWAIWMTGNIAVPLTPMHPPDMLRYFIKDSSASIVICTSEYEKLLSPITDEVIKPLLVTGPDKEITAQLYQPNSLFMKPKALESLTDVGKTNAWYGQNDALLIYTSGTTSRPKGVVWTHSMLSSQIAALHAAWRYSGQDVVLHALPLHHIHGQLNSLLASLAAGARIRMLTSFVSHSVWARLLGMGEEAKVTVFHGVPTMYARLVADHERLFSEPKTAEYVKATLGARMRLMCAGSAPLPASLFQKWEEISGIRLLERYGMSEVGMALSNPYRPAEARAVGCVGAPLPGVSARIAGSEPDPDGTLKPLVTASTPNPDATISLERLGLQPKEVAPEEVDRYTPHLTIHTMNEDEVEGELLLKGSGVFSRYYNRESNPLDFTADGWFRTGDTAAYSQGRFRILGRSSLDIIKTGGFKISALQVESALLDHPNIADAAVLGFEDQYYGEIVSAVVVLKDSEETLTLKDLKQYALTKLAPYQVPQKLLVVNKMPRNIMGKLDKKALKKQHGYDMLHN